MKIEPATYMLEEEAHLVEAGNLWQGEQVSREKQ